MKTAKPVCSCEQSLPLFVCACYVNAHGVVVCRTTVEDPAQHPDRRRGGASISLGKDTGLFYSCSPVITCRAFEDVKLTILAAIEEYGRDAIVQLMGSEVSTAMPRETPLSASRVSVRSVEVGSIIVIFVSSFFLSPVCQRL